MCVCMRACEAILILNYNLLPCEAHNFQMLTNLVGFYNLLAHTRTIYVSFINLYPNTLVCCVYVFSSYSIYHIIIWAYWMLFCCITDFNADVVAVYSFFLFLSLHHINYHLHHLWSFARAHTLFIFFIDSECPFYVCVCVCMFVCIHSALTLQRCKRHNNKRAQISWTRKDNKFICGRQNMWNILLLYMSECVQS